MLSTFTNTPECVDEIAIANSLDAAALLTIQAIYHDPKGQNGLHVNILHTIFWLHGMQVHHRHKYGNWVS